MKITMTAFKMVTPKHRARAISKGQGNYEGLSEHDGLFFMLMAKCPVIASDLGVDVGDIILKYKQ
jgi:uncharacterized protein with ATP-grasp and redox domains